MLSVRWIYCVLCDVGLYLLKRNCTSILKNAGTSRHISLFLSLCNVLFRWCCTPVAQPPWPQPLSAMSYAVIVDRDVKFMGISIWRQPASRRLMAFRKTKKSARAAIFIRSFTAEREAALSTSSTDPRSPSFQPLSSFSGSLPSTLVPALVLERLNRAAWAKSNNAISGRLRREAFEATFRASAADDHCSCASSHHYLWGPRARHTTACRGEVTCEVRSHAPRSHDQRKAGGRRE